MAISKPQDDHDKTCRLCLFPMDLLKIILSYLSVLDYINFRAVCKCWRLAFSECAASCDILSQEYPERELPWFLILKRVSSEKCSRSKYTRPVLHTTGLLGHLSPGPRYYCQTDIGELHGTRILLSKFGWLLLFTCSDQGNFDSSEIYFFNPFSKAKIVLPYMDVSKLLCAVFDISAPPTSPGCIIFIASTIYPMDVKIDLCSRGDSSWTSYQGMKLGPIINLVFANGIWYLLHTVGTFSKFDVFNRTSHSIRVKDFDLFYSSIVSYPIKRGERIFLRIHALECYEIELSNSLHTLVAKKVDYFNRNYQYPSDDDILNFQDSEYLFRTEVDKAIVQERGAVSIDSFNIDSWCCKFDVDGVVELRWHQFVSFRASIFHLHEDAICPLKNDCSTFVMWFEPVWVQPSPNLSWV